MIEKMRGIVVLSCALLWLGCSGRQEGASGACTSNEQCEQTLSDECPGGSSTYATCTDGTCKFEGCSSPIGTPCDDDPTTVFENEDCPEDDDGDDSEP